MLIGRFSILTRLVVGFGSVLALALGLGVFAAQQMLTLSDLTAKLYKHPFTVSTGAL